MRPVYVIVFLVLSGWIAMLSVSNAWNKDRIQSDVLEYYSYLPATFICKDIALKNSCEGRYWTAVSPTGGNVFRMTMGMSMVYLPFFGIAHLAAPIFHESQNGYSDPYQKMILIAGLFYTLLGLIFTFRSLKLFFSERVSVVSTLLIFFSTNLLYYSTMEPGMSHAFLFGLGSVFIYLVIKWHESITYSKTLAVGLILGLMILIRPTSILFCLIFLFYNVKTKQEFVAKVSLLFENYFHLLIMGLCVFLVLSPQLMYWKYLTGNWVYYSYGNQTFFWKNPHIMDGLFSFRKGWFVYTPIMFIACIGIFKIKKYVPSLFLPLIIFLPVFCYVTFSWWCWWYGGSFGQRSFIDIYCLMAFPLGSIITSFSQQKMIRFFIFCCTFFTVLNMFQSWQYSKGFIHYDSMTKKAYLLSFGKTTTTAAYNNSIEPPDYMKALEGKVEYLQPK